ncbi:MAG TPA: GNAT family protein [Ardenticatenaceae bacterium]|jgi:ribosomal-protein-alanine N-acetyltransferase
MAIDDVFTAFPLLETPNLILRQTRSSDAEAMFRIFSDEETVQYYGMMPHESLEDTVEFVRAQRRAFERRQSIRWGITCRGDDTLIGSCGFHNFDNGFHRAEVGYELNRAYWGRGIMAEALRCVVDCGFAQMGLNRIEAIIDDDNERSKNLLRKVGFTYEGCMRQRFFHAGRFWDEFWFSLLKEDYQRLSSS